VKHRGGRHSGEEGVGTSSGMDLGEVVEVACRTCEEACGVVRGEGRDVGEEGENTSSCFGPVRTTKRKDSVKTSDDQKKESNGHKPFVTEQTQRR
jgi:hypothetical protein